MDLDTSPSQQPVQPGLAEARISRTPLPSAPRPERTVNMAPLPGLDNFRTDLQGSADRILANPFRSRYAAVSVLLVRWQDDDDIEDEDDEDEDLDEDEDEDEDDLDDEEDDDLEDEDDDDLEEDEEDEEEDA